MEILRACQIDLMLGTLGTQAHFMSVTVKRDSKYGNGNRVFRLCLMVVMISIEDLTMSMFY